MRSTWIDLNLLSSVFIRERQRERRPREDEAEIGEVLPQAKNHQEPPETGSGKWDFSPRAFGGSAALLTPWLWISDLWNCKKIHFYCFKPPVCGNLLQQSWETNLLLSSRPSQLCAVLLTESCWEMQHIKACLWHDLNLDDWESPWKSI